MGALLGDFRVSWGRFWEPFGHLFGHGCESENVFLLNTVLFEFLVDFRVSWGSVWEPFGHLFGHGCESENSAGACTGARFSRFMGGRVRSFLRALREPRFERPLLRGFVPI